MGKTVRKVSSSEYSNGSDSSDDEDVHNYEITKKNILRLMAIELIKNIISKNNDKTNYEIFDLFCKEIDNIQDKIYKRSRKNSAYKNRLKSEISYYKYFLQEMKELHSKNNNFDISEFIDKQMNKICNNNDNKNPINFCFMTMPSMSMMPLTSSDEQHYMNDDNNLYNDFIKLYNADTTTNCSYEYFKKASIDEQQMIIEKLTIIKDVEESIKPNMLKVLEWNTTDSNKLFVLSKLNQFENLNGSSEYFKLKSWINKLMSIPFGAYIKPPVTKESTIEEISEYLRNTKQIFDNNIYGHEESKDRLIKIIAQTITNPVEGGNIFALQGPPGVGKTAIIHDGISKALNRPFAFISLGGATDSAYLEGFDYTYEGSNHGKIADVLIQTKCMNPIIYFDELDKVSDTPKGEEIINSLMHLTDITQNHCFTDKYFGGITLDLSKVIMIFSFNDIHKVSHILRDRMKIINVKSYKLHDKLLITQNYVLPKLFKSFGLTNENVKISNEIIEFIINNYTHEGGVRRLKEILNDILLEINLRRLQDPTKSNITITKKILLEDILKKRRKITILRIDNKSKIGVVNGLWANCSGAGGLIPIECSWIPTNIKLELELTGMQGQVMKESMIVAKTVAWRVLPKAIKDKLYDKWNSTLDHGVHIHCPDGATPKDGPSAGGAITTCLISLFSDIPVNNKIAMTGEINLKGQITAIGGLEEKLYGAKKAGATKVLCPKENQIDYQEIVAKNPTLIEDNFEVIMVSNIWEVLKIVLVDNKINFVKF